VTSPRFKKMTQRDRRRSGEGGANSRKRKQNGLEGIHGWGVWAARRTRKKGERLNNGRSDLPRGGALAGLLQAWRCPEVGKRNGGEKKNTGWLGGKVSNFGER